MTAEVSHFGSIDGLGDIILTGRGTKMSTARKGFVALRTQSGKQRLAPEMSENGYERVVQYYAVIAGTCECGISRGRPGRLLPAHISLSIGHRGTKGGCNLSNANRRDLLVVPRKRCANEQTEG